MIGKVKFMLSRWREIDETARGHGLGVNVGEEIVILIRALRGCRYSFVARQTHFGLPIEIIDVERFVVRP